jgi:hypothetical protein
MKVQAEFCPVRRALKFDHGTAAAPFLAAFYSPIIKFTIFLVHE